MEPEIYEGREDTIMRDPVLRRAVDRFRLEACEKHEELDADGLMDWDQLAFGFFMGCGLDAEKAELCHHYVAVDRNFFRG